MKFMPKEKYQPSIEEMNRAEEMSVGEMSRQEKYVAQTREIVEKMSDEDLIDALTSVQKFSDGTEIMRKFNQNSHEFEFVQKTLTNLDMTLDILDKSYTDKRVLEIAKHLNSWEERYPKQRLSSPAITIFHEVIAAEASKRMKGSS